MKVNLDVKLEPERIIHKPEDLCIDSILYNIPNLEKMKFYSELFNQMEYFISYTPFTFTSVLAAMCGCKSIILNEDSSILPIEYRSQSPFLQYGVSYGLKDISWANKTVHLTRDYILDLDKYHKKTVNNFVNDLTKLIYDK